MLVAGSIGPLGLGVQSRHPEPDEIQDIFYEQALALEERGVDLFILETFSYIEELLLAIDAIRSFSGLPIIAQLTYSEEGTTFGDLRPTDAAAQLKNKNVQVIGANCTLGPQALLPILQELAGVDGCARQRDAECGFPETRRRSHRVSQIFAGIFCAVRARSRGHGRAHSGRLLRNDSGAHSGHGGRGEVAATRAATTVAHVECAAKPAAVAEREPESKFWRKLQNKEFAVCVEIDPPKGISLDRVFEQVDKSWHRGKWTPSTSTAARWRAWAWTRWWSPGALEARGVETVPHLTTRDYNIIGLQAMLLGAWTVGGVRNVLAITGDPPSVGDYPETSGVYEVDSVGLVKILHRLNQGTDWAGKTLGGATNFAIGVAVNPVADDLDGEIERFHAKSRSGRALRHDAAAVRSRALVRVCEKIGRKAGDSGADRDLAAEQLQTGAAAEQRSAGHRDSAGGAEIDGRRRERRRAIGDSNSAQNAGVGTHGTGGSVLDSAV